MLHHPQILFLDEPTIGLDFHAAKVIRDFLLYMNKEHKMTILLTSHYTKDIEELCDRVILINHGQMVYDGPLASMDDRIYGQRVIDLRFKNEEDLKVFQDHIPSLQEAMKMLMLGESEEVLTLRLLIPTKDTQDLLRLVLQKASFADIMVGEQPLDEIFTQLYKNGRSPDTRP
jgi:ABC-2 type transport system ATP-binding protein